MDVGIKTANDQFQSVTTTERTAITSPIVGQCVWDSDLRQLMVYMNATTGNAWQPIGNSIVCASTTRPVTPFEGQQIYETDTNLNLVYNGTAWGIKTYFGQCVASGGTETSITNAGIAYKVHTFTASSSLIVATGGVVEVLVVAGGGGGGGSNTSVASGAGSGGGGGGVLYYPRYSVTASTITVTIGAGGAGAAAGMNDGVAGTDSVFGSLTATGGGLGRQAIASTLYAGGNGGSGFVLFNYVA